ncbi:MAG TPA: hypothetical protein VKV23_07675 [Acidimicrobiales bacterium]|nr:hypothetical protein [Acidimicrobiales bacterium]
MTGVPGRRRLLRRARTAASLPGRVVACEDRVSALEARVAARLDEIRAELAEVRSLLTGVLDAEADATELVGRLLRASTDRLEALEAALGGRVGPPDA